MRYLKACLMSMTMFCAIPLPFHKWDDDLRPLMTACLPIVGLEIGLVWAALTYILFQLVGFGWFPKTLAAGVFVVYPHIITGFLHLDGFMDVVDAIKSQRDLAERRKILKDSNVGAFAVISVCILFVLAYSAASSLTFKDENIVVLIFIPILSRCLSALVVTLMPPMRDSQFAGKYRKGITMGHIIFPAVIALIVMVLGIVFCKFYVFVLVAVFLGYLGALMKAYINLKGMNGDIAGFALTIAEFSGIIVYSLIGPITALLS